MSPSQKRPLLSVVTITYNDLVGLVRTLDSLRALFEAADGRMEVIVQDGLSSGDLGMIQASYGNWVDFRSEADNGIYDAMNRGLARTRGDYVWFLNGGDEAAIDAWQDVRELLDTRPGSMVLAAYWLDLGSKRVLRLPREISYLWHGLPTSHQAIFYPGDLARATKYDASYKVAGDYAFTASLSRACACVTTQKPVAVFRVGGTSHVHAPLIAAEAGIVQSRILTTGRARRTASRLLHLASRWRRKMAVKSVVQDKAC